MHIRTVAHCLGTVVIAGCSVALPLTPENASTTALTSSHSPERAYRNTIDAMRVCYPAGFTIERNFFPEAKEGEITLAAVDSTYRAESIKLHVKPAADGASTISLTKRKNASSDWDKAAQEWANGRSDLCPSGTKIDPRRQPT